MAILGSVILLLSIPIAIICLLFVVQFNAYLSKNYSNLGRNKAWNVSHIAANDPELSKLAMRVRISLYVMLTTFVILLLCGAGIAALSI
jgi:hypothetical protein